MKKIVFLLVCSVMAIGMRGQTKNFIDQPYLETSARVDTLVTPDIIYLHILIREQDEKGRVSVEEMENKMAGKLKSLGIDVKEQLTLDDLGSHFKKYFLKRKDIMKSKSYKLKLFDAQMAGKVIVGLEDIGISNVDLGKMEYSKIEELRLALKSMAVAKAKRQAEYLMEPLQQNVGGALHISDRFFHTPVYQTRNMALAEMAMAKSADYAPIDIDFGPIKVESEVAVKFKIE